MNTVDFEALQAQEDKVLAELDANTPYNNPYDDFADALRTGDCRRFITGFKEVDYTDLIERQVAERIFDRVRCKEYLIPLIKRDGLQNPPLVEEASHSPGNFNMLTGHHRAYSMDQLGEKIPVITVSKNYNITGGSVPADINIVQGVQANKPQTHRTYNRKDAVYILSEALRMNPTQDGRYTGTGIPPRETSDGSFSFDNLVDRVMGPDRFPHKGTRTKIYNELVDAPNRAKLVEIDDAALTAHLQYLGWNTGLRKNARGKQTRCASDEHFDTANNSMIIPVDDNGRHLQEKVFGVVERYHSDDEYRNNLQNNNIRHINIAARIYKPSTDKAALDSARNKFLNRIRDMNTLLSKLNVSLDIKFVSFIKQLKTAADTHTTYTV
jgi:hypothetical protein